MTGFGRSKTHSLACNETHKLGETSSAAVKGPENNGGLDEKHDGFSNIVRCEMATSQTHGKVWGSLMTILGRSFPSACVRT